MTQQLAIAHQHYEKKQFAEAEIICHQMLEEHCKAHQLKLSPAPPLSTDIEIRLLLGMALQQQQKLTAAQHCYEHILQLQPDHAATYNNLALVFKARTPPL